MSKKMLLGILVLSFIATGAGAVIECRSDRLTFSNTLSERV